MRIYLIWSALGAVILWALVAAGQSPLHAFRTPVYIIASFAGIVAFALLLVQPLLGGGYVSGLMPRQRLTLHRWIGAAATVAVIAHIAGLWITSPPDVVDALLFVSPTPFSLWGVIAMWALFVTALWAVSRRRMRLRARHWQWVHSALALVIAAGTIAHALLIDGTMGLWSKIALCLAVGSATLMAVWRKERQGR